MFDKNFHSLPPFIGNDPWIIGGAALLPQSLVVLVGTGVDRRLRSGSSSTRTLTGKAMLATAANRLAARLVGIDTVLRSSACRSRSRRRSARIGGILVTPITLTNYDVGTLLALKGFAAAMLGGMGNPLGAVVGGLLLGLLEAFSAGYLSSPTRTRSPSWSSWPSCSPCRRACSASAASSGCDRAALHREPLCAA